MVKITLQHVEPQPEVLMSLFLPQTSVTDHGGANKYACCQNRKNKKFCFSVNYSKTVIIIYAMSAQTFVLKNNEKPVTTAQNSL